MKNEWTELARELTRLLGLTVPPIAITFGKEAPPDGDRFQGAPPEPTDDGRTGMVPASCVFWTEATEKSFVTLPEDHGNCSIGQMTHGLKTLDQVAGNADVAALLESGWVTMDMVPGIAVVKERPAAIGYGPLEETRVDPDIVFMRLNARQVMILHDALPGLRFEGKPQCHIVAIAKEEQQAAVSVGCMLSRVRTGIPNSEMTCALPAGQLRDIVVSLESTARADMAVAAYASKDAERFGR